MILKNMYSPDATSKFPLLIVLVVVLVLLASCGGATTTSTSSATTPTTVASAPTAISPTPTPTLVPQTPVSGSTQVIKIITNSDGSFAFSPALLTIRVGTTVIWKNVSSAEHSVTSDDGTTFDSGTLPVGKNFQFKFSSAGSFPYHCNIHPYMRATIVVV